MVCNWRLGLTGSLMLLGGCMVQQPVGYYPDPYNAYRQPRPGAPLVLAPQSLPAAPQYVPPPVAVEPLPPPNDAVMGGPGQMPPPPDDLPPSDNAAAMPAVVVPDSAKDFSPPAADADVKPMVATPVATDPSIQQQLATIKQNLTPSAPPVVAAPAKHEKYGGLSSAGDVAP